MLTSIKIERFKNISEIELSLESINILVGSNNSGKSSILHAIQFAVSVAQSSKSQNARWSGGRCPTSLSSQALIYTPLRDIEALAPHGNLRTDAQEAMKITFSHCDGNSTFVTIRKGKNKNISTDIVGEVLGVELQNIESPFVMIVPGLAGIPAFEEYKPPSFVRKAAAKGDANSVFRNILWLLSKDIPSWSKFLAKLNKLFPDISIHIDFDQDKDEHINTRVSKEGVFLPIDSSGTGVLQAIQIISYYFLYQPKVLILDEPDSHLHPDNQRILATVLQELVDEEKCQIIISTHSRHLLSAMSGLAKLHWLRKFSLVADSDDLERKLLLDLGALDKGDLLQNGAYKCVLLTEDSDPDFIKILCQASGFSMNEVDVWSYDGCTKIDVALAINSFVMKHAPAAKVILHRDRDYLTDEEVRSYVTNLDESGIMTFITDGNDSEWHFINSDHIHELYNQLSKERINEIIDLCIQDRLSKIKEKYINIIHDRRLQQSYKGGDRPNPGRISNECDRLLRDSPRQYMHGKTVLNYLKSKLQQEIGGNVNLCRVTASIRHRELTRIANLVWPERV